MKKAKFLWGSSIIGAAFVALVATGMKSNTLRTVPVSAVRSADDTPKSFVGQRLRLAGYVSYLPVQRTTEPSPSGAVDVAHFLVEDKGKFVRVTFRDALPDSFRAGGPVQVDGVYDAPGRIAADHVLTKCPSKYDQLKAPPKAAPKGASSSHIASNPTAPAIPAG